MAEFINTIDVLGDDAVIDSIIDRTITEYKDDSVTEIGVYAFKGCSDLAIVDCPNASSFKEESFGNCTKLTDVNLPNAELIGRYAFQNCTSLVTIDLPKAVDYVGDAQGVFSGCKNLQQAHFPVLKRVYIGMFINGPAIPKLDLPCCTDIMGRSMPMPALETLILRANQVCTLGNVSALNNTKIKAGTGYIYVPRALVDSYKTATNWSTYAAQFRALEDYTVDGTVTGELDESKI